MAGDNPFSGLVGCVTACITGKDQLLIDDPNVGRTIKALQLAVENLPESEHSEKIKAKNPLLKVKDLLIQLSAYKGENTIDPKVEQAKLDNKAEIDKQFNEPHIFSDAAKYFGQHWEALQDSIYTMHENGKLPAEDAKNILAVFTDRNKEKTLGVLKGLAEDLKGKNRNGYAEKLGVPKTIGVGMRY